MKSPEIETCFFQFTQRETRQTFACQKVSGLIKYQGIISFCGMNRSNRFLNIGHRGAAALARENTVASFRKAIACGADAIEFDVRKTIDGVLVLFHDRTITTEKGRRPVSTLTFDELTGAAALWSYTIPTLEEILRGFGDRIPMFIEIKARGFEVEVVSALKKFKPAFPPMISSFLPWIVGRIKALDENLDTGLIFGRERTYRLGLFTRPVLRRMIKSLAINSIHLEESQVNPRLVGRLVDNGLKIFVWTVDNEDSMRKLIYNRVNGIITNKPDLLRTVCSEMADSEEPILRKTAGEPGRFTYIDISRRK
jgi:glycerophosphoryl diester phosphodiesterase